MAIEELSAAVPRLTAERDDLQSQLDAAVLTIEVLKRDLMIIGAALKAEAEERGWCSDYRYFVENVNRQCSGPHLQPCTARWELRYQVTVDVTSQDLDATEQQVYGELNIDELEAGTLHRVNVSLVNRQRVDES